MSWVRCSQVLCVIDSVLQYQVLVYTAHGEQLQCYRPYENALGVKSVAWHPHGHMLAVGSFDERCRAWASRARTAQRCASSRGGRVSPATALHVLARALGRLCLRWQASSTHSLGSASPSARTLLRCARRFLRRPSRGSSRKWPAEATLRRACRSPCRRCAQTRTRRIPRWASGCSSGRPAASFLSRAMTTVRERESPPQATPSAVGPRAYARARLCVCRSAACVVGVGWRLDAAALAPAAAAACARGGVAPDAAAARRRHRRCPSFPVAARGMPHGARSDGRTHR
jgi:hypothetical protein